MNIAAVKGSGPFHRALPTVKLFALFCLSILLFATSALVILASVSGIVIASILVLCREAIIQWLRAWPLLLTISVVVVWTAFVRNVDDAIIVFLRLGTLSLFATAVTVTTSIGQFIDTITKFAQPLEKIGLANARDIGLAIGLVIRFVPDVQQRYRAIAEAHRARGLKLRLHTVIVPMVIGTLQSAEDIASAIDARSIRTDKRSEERFGNAD
ncbi:energy-coupling factor transporter transmembrane protein EcfT [Ochrobactrum vermis]|uniref:Energy-coupling factor transporter transmembrane protein EcfT n=1 Tax=Ochrobactrum vermis TaxID=1827297 RepID=A0ABU8PFN0_9HYPH|nr:energy-coupling factor transporter transmembrane protein EcfT [Ochrobactrum vermis]PQZ25470.1 transporter [Ochrobactrum vermis]